MILLLLSPPLSALLPAQVPNAPKIAILRPISPPKTHGWKAAAVSPAALAARADVRLNGLKNTVADWTVVLNLPTGRGQAYGRDVIYSASRFRIETVAVKLVRRNELNKTTWRADNGRLAVLGTSAWEPRGIAASYAKLPNPLLPTFLTGFDGVIKRGVAGAKPISAVVAVATKAGYTAVAERRASDPSELRIVLTKGATRYEMAFTEPQLLPTSVQSEAVVNGKTIRILWLQAWAVKGAPLTPQDVASYHPPRPKGLDRG